MTELASAPAPAATTSWSRGIGWIVAKDPGLLAVKRSVRAGVVMPVVFGLTHWLFSNAQVSLFGAFGSFSLLLLVDFPGKARTRLTSYVALLLVGGCFISVGTAVSTHKVAAVLVMAGVGFGVLFVGIISPHAAAASTAVLLILVLPTAVAQPASAIGFRLLGWAFAGVFCIPACMLVWRTPWHDNLRRHLSATVSAVARLADSYAAGQPDPGADAELQSQVSLLRKQVAGTPYPTTGYAAGAVGVAKLVGRVEWVAGNTALIGHDVTAPTTPLMRSMIAAVADTLHRSAALICDTSAYPVDDPFLVHELEASIGQLDQLIGAEVDSEVSLLIENGPDQGDRQGASGRGGIASSLDPGFQVRAVGIAAGMVADATLEAAGIPAVSDRWLDSGEGRVVRLFWHRIASYLSFRSVWLRNAVRGGVGLGLAIAIVEITDVEHGFWVVLGTLSVLRSNALGTGATAVRAVGGTAVGFIVGSAIMAGVGTHTGVLWIILPIAVLVSGVAPSMISFAAGQAGFTLVVIILFNIIVPTGWKLGLTRIEDVAIGCGVSIVVGLLFWPRGATAALGRALSDAFVTGSGYLADAVDHLTTMTRHIDTSPSERASHRAYLRLDDAFRQFLGERGAKVVAVEDVATLFTGSNRIRMAAYTLATLPPVVPDPGQSELESVALAGAVLRDSYASSHRWYEQFAELLRGQRDVLDAPPGHEETLHGALRTAFDDARVRRRADRLRTVLQMLWADEILENQRQVQSELAASADLFARQRYRGFI